MKMKLMSKLTALALAVVLAFGAASCSTADQSWSAEKDGDRLPVGVYVYNLYAAINAAGQQEGVDSSVSLLDQQIDGQSAEDWIRAEALRYTKEIYYLRDQLDALGIPLTEDEQAQAESLAASAWGYIPDSVKKYVAQDSFVIAYGETSVMYSKLFDAIYGEGGSNEVPDDDLRAYFEDTYYDFDYVLSSLSYKEDTELTGEEGESSEMTEEEASARRELFEGYAEKINAGEMTMEEAAEDFASVISSEDEELTHQLIDGAYIDSYFPDGVRAALDEMADGEVRTLEVSTLSDGILLLQKNALSDAYDTFLETESNRDTLLIGLKSDEFAASVESGCDALEGVTFNDEAISTYKVSEFYTFTPSSSSSAS